MTPSQRKEERPVAALVAPHIRALLEVSPAAVAAATVEMGRAVVEHDASTTADALADAVALVGCEVTSMKVERRLPLSG